MENVLEKIIKQKKEDINKIKKISHLLKFKIILKTLIIFLTLKIL